MTIRRATGRACRTSRTRAAAGAALTLAAMAAGGSTMNGAVPDPSAEAIGRLLGRWAGQGSVVPASGAPEAFKCIVTYRTLGHDPTLHQNLRCKSDNFSFDAATRLQIGDGRVTGTWEEHANSLSGDVVGRITPTGFDIYLSGRFFEAQMVVAGSACAQDVKLTPLKADYIREMSASLRKC